MGRKGNMQTHLAKCLHMPKEATAIDYFRYLNDNYPSLSMLMQVLCSFSSVSLVSRAIHSPLQNGTNNMYTNDEQLKLEYLRGRWGIASAAASLFETKEDATKSRITGHNDRSGAAVLSASVVLDEWKEAIESELLGRGVDFCLLENKINGVSDFNMSVEPEDRMEQESMCTEFLTKVPLKDLFKPAEATI
ncbi:unnamed protein product [Peronospora belbahrii]|uniref:Uncharacterized protein n=1 Tax=Peronospora belbahrii TaxID=622444 RepID=A0AAU9L6B3_9STRA|nr:unnamed protein product [Peronospora belbahrii]CAH0521413.1 unnamed protein product [Peronospora belbahrii]